MNFRFTRFQTRLLVFLMTLVMIVLGAVYYFVNRQNLENARDVIVSDLRLGADNFDATIARRNEALAIAADALSADYAFKQVYATEDHSTILSAMYNLLNRLTTADFMVLVSDDDRIIASTRRPESRDGTPSWVSLIERARRLIGQGRYPETEGVTVIEGTPYHMTILPFMNPDLEAWIALGFEIGQAFTAELKQSISAEVSVIFRDADGDWTSHASTLPEARLSALMAEFDTVRAAETGTAVIPLDGEEFVTLGRPIVETGDTVQVILQRSLSRQLAPYQALNRTLLVTFAAGLLVLALGVVFISRRVTRPVLELAQSAAKIEAGNYRQSVDIPQRDEIGRLAAAFNSMARGLAEKERQLTRLAHYDTLTNLPNRLLLNSRLEHAIHRARHAGSKLAVLYLDLDNFKSINDSLGHSSGDELLVKVAERFRARVKDEDTIARLGGDDFLVVAEFIRAPREAASLGESLLACLEEPFALTARESIFTSASIGISLYPDDGEDGETLIRKADTAIHRSKHRGRNTVSFYSRGMGEEAEEQLELITALRHGIQRDEFLVYYQPKYSVATGEPRGAEALVRWHRDGTGMVSPGKFIPVAEQSGLITAMGSIILEQVAGQVRAWQDTYVDPGQISINISARQFSDQDLAGTIADTLSRHEIPPSLIGLEITESTLMENPGKVQETLAELKALGIRIYLDDFGTGFSSFAYLSRFDIDVLKIDQSFIKKIGHSEKDDRIIASMIDLARNLGMEAVAEGVETEAQLAFLRANRCETFQGFLKSRPLPVDEYTAMLESHAVFDQNRNV